MKKVIKKALISAKHLSCHTTQITSRKVEEMEREMQIKLKRKCNINGIKLTPPKQIQQISNSISPEQITLRCHIDIKIDIPF